MDRVGRIMDFVGIHGADLVEGVLQGLQDLAAPGRGETQYEVNRFNVSSGRNLRVIRTCRCCWRVSGASTVMPPPGPCPACAVLRRIITICTIGSTWLTVQ